MERSTHLLSRYDFFRDTFTRIRREHPDWSVTDILQTLGDKWGLSLHQVRELFDQHKRYAETIGETWFDIKIQPFPAFPNTQVNRRMKTSAKAIFGSFPQKPSPVPTNTGARKDSPREASKREVKEEVVMKRQIQLPEQLQDAYKILLEGATKVEDSLIVIAPTRVLSKRFGSSKAANLYWALRRRGVLQEVDKSKIEARIGKTPPRAKIFEIVPEEMITFRSPAPPTKPKPSPEPKRELLLQKEVLKKREIDAEIEELLLWLLQVIGKKLEKTSLPLTRHEEEKLISFLELARDIIALLTK